MTIKEAIDELRSVHYINDDWLNSDKTNKAIKLLLRKIDNGYVLVNPNKLMDRLNEDVFTFIDDGFMKHYVVEQSDVFRRINEQVNED